MARHFSPQKKRNKANLSPHQRIISQYFTPRSGISKEEVNFLVKSNPATRGEKSRRATDVQGCTNQITFTPAFGFTTAAKIHQQAGGCYSETQNQQILSGQRNSGSATGNSAVSECVTCACSPLKNSSTERKQTHFDNTRVLHLMASSTSSSSSTPTSDSSSSCPSTRNTTNTRRSNSRAQNHMKCRSAKNQKCAPETIIVDSEDENCSSDDDCCVIMNVVCDRNLKSDSEVEESSSCCQSSTSIESSSQESETSKGESGSKSYCSSESDQKNAASFCNKSSLSSKSARHTKEQASAKSTFGLVGGDVSDSDDDDSRDLSQCDSDFAQFPVEILENIFCQLPIVDLMLNCALVCRQWYDIISRDLVMVFTVFIIMCC